MGFKQVNQERLDNSGVASVLAYIEKSSKELELIFDLQFEKTNDDLDYCDIALLETDSGQLFMLKHYERAPGPKHTYIFGNERSKNPKRDLDEILEALTLNYSEVKLVHVDIIESVKSKLGT